MSCAFSCKVTQIIKFLTSKKKELNCTVLGTEPMMQAFAILNFCINQRIPKDRNKLIDAVQNWCHACHKFLSRQES